MKIHTGARPQRFREAGRRHHLELIDVMTDDAHMNEMRARTPGWSDRREEEDCRRPAGRGIPRCLPLPIGSAGQITARSRRGVAAGLVTLALAARDQCLRNRLAAALS